MNTGTKKMASINKDDDSVLTVATLWLDKNRQFFVGDYEPSTAEETLYCVKCRQVAEQSDNLEPELVETFLNIPVMI